MPFPDAQQPVTRNRLVGALDVNQLKLTEGGCAFNQSRG